MNLRVIRKIKKIHQYYSDSLKRIELQNQEIISLNKELLWSEIYHDSIRDCKSLRSFSINVGRWAGNYTFFYLLFRILSSCRPNSILELGLGESTKFISTFIENEMTDCRHVVVEHDTSWHSNFNKQFTLGFKTRVELVDLVQKEFKGTKVTTYTDQLSNIAELYEFYVLDGPFGSDRYSRIDILSIVDRFPLDHEFVILFDDTHRNGERKTFNLLLEKLADKGFEVHHTQAQGIKDVSLVVSSSFKWLTSI